MSFVESTTRCNTCAIRNRAICDALSTSEIQSLNRISRRKLVPSGQTILGEGDAHTIFANIVSGVVKLTKTLDDGRQHIIGLLFASDFLGRAFRKDNPYFAEAAIQARFIGKNGNYDQSSLDFSDLYFPSPSFGVDPACRDFGRLHIVEPKTPAGEQSRRGIARGTDDLFP